MAPYGISAFNAEFVADLTKSGWPRRVLLKAHHEGVNCALGVRQFSAHENTSALGSTYGQAAKRLKTPGPSDRCLRLSGVTWMRWDSQDEVTDHLNTLGLHALRY